MAWFLRMKRSQPCTDGSLKSSTLRRCRSPSITSLRRKNNSISSQHQLQQQRRDVEMQQTCCANNDNRPHRISSSNNWNYYHQCNNHNDDYDVVSMKRVNSISGHVSRPRQQLDDGNSVCSDILFQQTSILHEILENMRVLTNKVHRDEEFQEESNNWKFAAMVLDRCFLWLFTIFTAITTFAILFSAPNSFGWLSTIRVHLFFFGWCTTNTDYRFHFYSLENLKHFSEWIYICIYIYIYILYIYIYIYIYIYYIIYIYIYIYIYI